MTNDISISDFISIKGLSLSEIEKKFILNGLDENSFCVYKRTFSDGSEDICFNPPTDFTPDMTNIFLHKVLVSIH